MSRPQFRFTSSFEPFEAVYPPWTGSYYFLGRPPWEFSEIMLAANDLEVVWHDCDNPLVPVPA